MFFLAQIKSHTQFVAALDELTEVDQLNDTRDTLRRYQASGDKLPIWQERWGYALAYKALDKRAAELGLTKYSFGYRKVV